VLEEGKKRLPPSPPILQANGSQVSETAAGWMMVEQGFWFPAGSHPTARAMLLKVHFVEGPQIDPGIPHQRLEFLCSCGDDGFSFVIRAAVFAVESNAGMQARKDTPSPPRGTSYPRGRTPILSQRMAGARPTDRLTGIPRSIRGRPRALASAIGAIGKIYLAEFSKLGAIESSLRNR
jgi:hypothetical protein